MKFGALKLFHFGLWFLLLLISALSTTTESSRVIFQRSTSTKPLVGNIVSVPMVRCRDGYHLDHRKKCRKIVSSWFR